MNISPQSENTPQPGKADDYLSTNIDSGNDPYPAWMKPMGYDLRINEALGK